MEYSDPYQPFRMILIWPIIVGVTAFWFVRLVASTTDGHMTRWQAVLAGICGIMAAVVSTIIARHWTGADTHWLAFTIGLAFAALVMLNNVIVTISEAGSDA